MGKLRYRNLVPAEGMSNMFVNIRLATSPQAVKRIAAHVGKELVAREPEPDARPESAGRFGVDTP